MEHILKDVYITHHKSFLVTFSKILRIVILLPLFIRRKLGTTLFVCRDKKFLATAFVVQACLLCKTYLLCKLLKSHETDRQLSNMLEKKSVLNNWTDRQN